MAGKIVFQCFFSVTADKCPLLSHLTKQSHSQRKMKKTYSVAFQTIITPLFRNGLVCFSMAGYSWFHNRSHLLCWNLYLPYTPKRDSRVVLSVTATGQRHLLRIQPQPMIGKAGSHLGIARHPLWVELERVSALGKNTFLYSMDAYGSSVKEGGRRDQELFYGTWRKQLSGCKEGHIYIATALM